MAAVNVFWDTNVLLDFIDRRPFELDSTDAIYELAVHGQIQIASSEQVVCTVLYLSDILKADLAIAEFLRISSSLPTNKSIMLTALSSPFKDKQRCYSLSPCAESSGRFFITRDKKLFEYALPILPVMTPGEYVQQRR